MPVNQRIPAWNKRILTLTNGTTLIWLLIAWCPLGLWHDGPYKGPKHPCPLNPECNDGKDHYLRKRWAWVCQQCTWVEWTKTAADRHDCNGS